MEFLNETNGIMLYVWRSVEKCFQSMIYFPLPFFSLNCCRIHCLFICSVNSVFLNGTSRRREFSLSPNALFLGILREFLYWVDEMKSVKRADKYTAGEPSVIADLNFSPTGMLLFAEERQNCECLDYSLDLFTTLVMRRVAK